MEQPITYLLFHDCLLENVRRTEGNRLQLSAISGQAGFTLLELLIVISIAVMMFAFAGSAMNNVSREMNISSGGEIIAATLQTAHDFALTHNRDVEIRLYSYPTQSSNSTPTYRAMQIFSRNVDVMSASVQGDGAAADDNAATFTPLGNIVYLPAGTVISNVPGDSPIIDSSRVLSSESRPGNLPAIPGFGLEGQSSYTYKYFSMLANGSTDLAGSNTLYYLTVIKENDWRLSRKPANYSIIQVDSSIGNITVYRP